MAKYSLNRANKVHCSILDENCLANTYTVKFDNGIVRNVPKSKVSNLDRIDEGVLSRLKEVGQNLLDNLVKLGHNLFYKLKNGALGQTLMNVMFRAEEKEGMAFYPAPSFVKICDAAGVEATESDEDFPEDPRFIEEANAYWEAVCGLNQANESYRTSSYSSRVVSRVKRARRLYEAKADIKLAAPEDGFPNIDVAGIRKKLIEQYSKFLFHGAGIPGGHTPIPYCIWGAPGIGKTQIIKALIKHFQAQGFDANMICINALTIRKDDFTLPGVNTIAKKVKRADGSVVDFNIRQAAELAKQWLPTYDPDTATDEVTEEMLDDIVNGGDGSGNGKGGFLFIDELSRVSPDVMDALMQLVQSRTLGTHKLGSKWMIVAAANRISDMDERGEMVQWEAAYTGRWGHLNFVPTFEDWCEWAEGVDDTGKPRIKPILVQFLKEHPNFWYSAAAGNDSGDMIADTMYPTGRGWENASKEIDDAEASAEKYLDGEDDDPEAQFLRMSFDKGGLRTNKPTRKDLNPYEISQILRSHVGNRPAAAFAPWAGFDARYTNEMAKEVWTKGDKADMNFQISPATVEKALVKVLANHPKYKGKKEDKIDITPTQMLNVMKFLVACSDRIDGGSGDTKTQVLKAGYATLVKLICNAPFRVDLSSPNSSDMDKYDDALSLYAEEVNKSKDAAVNQYN